MGVEQDRNGAGSSSTAAATGSGAPNTQAAPAPYPTTAAVSMQPPPGMPPPTSHAQGAPPQNMYAPPPPSNYYAQQQVPTVVEGRPPLVSIISPDDAKKIRKMQWINFGCTMIQLVCSLVIILLVRNRLTSLRLVSSAAGPIVDYTCFAATSAYPSTCEYAYSLASVSIFFCFILSLMQCLTMDCCGMGRAVEAGFDAAACIWWIAGGITLGIRATQANGAGIPMVSSRNAVVGLAWVSAFMFLALLITNLILIKRLGRAYKHAAQQMQQHMTAYPVGNVQMMQMGQHTGPYTQPGAYPPQPGTAPGGFQAPQQGAFPTQQQQQQWGPTQQQQQQWGPPPGYPTTPPTGQNAV